jgi:hypothetical protein
MTKAPANETEKTPTHVKVRMSERERLVLVAHFNGPGGFNAGSPEAMMALGDIFDTLGVSELSAKAAKIGKTEGQVSSVVLTDFDNDPKEYKIQPQSVGVLRQIMARQGQDKPMALLSIGVLRRLEGK